MSIQGPANPNTVVDDSSIGTISWINPLNVKMEDEIFSTTTFTGNQTTHYIKVTNFGFGIPAGSTINGIMVEVKGKIDSGYSGGWDLDIARIVKNGSVSATNRKIGYYFPYFTKVNAYLHQNIVLNVEGDPTTDLWGETWTAENINNQDFGVAISHTGNNGRTFYADNIRITVYYTVYESATSRLTEWLALIKIKP